MNFHQNPVFGMLSLSTIQISPNPESLWFSLSRESISVFYFQNRGIHQLREVRKGVQRVNWVKEIFNQSSGFQSPLALHSSTPYPPRHMHMHILTHTRMHAHAHRAHTSGSADSPVILQLCMPISLLLHSPMDRLCLSSSGSLSFSQSFCFPSSSFCCFFPSLVSYTFKRKSPYYLFNGAEVSGAPSYVQSTTVSWKSKHQHKKMEDTKDMQVSTSWCCQRFRAKSGSQVSDIIFFLTAIPQTVLVSKDINKEQVIVRINIFDCLVESHVLSLLGLP